MNPEKTLDGVAEAGGPSSRFQLNRRQRALLVKPPRLRAAAAYSPSGGHVQCPSPLQ